MTAGGHRPPLQLCASGFHLSQTDSTEFPFARGITQLLLHPSVAGSPPATTPESSQTRSHCALRDTDSNGEARPASPTGEMAAPSVRSSRIRGDPASPIAPGAPTEDTKKDRLLNPRHRPEHRQPVAAPSHRPHRIAMSNPRSPDPVRPREFSGFQHSRDGSH